jgi:hypothetical protein
MNQHAEHLRRIAKDDYKNNDFTAAALRECADEIERLEQDKVRLDWITRNRVQLNCSMGAPGNYHFQVGSHPSEANYREAIDKRMALKLPIDR